ncbi:hypothetical protein PQX77_002029 [Marasmius sp. AFHP31]|nr:hypothetical protein PQX77_002029 [Marasmius sp. AFHP31]
MLEIEDWNNYKGLDIDNDNEDLNFSDQTAEIEFNAKEAFERAITNDLEFDGEFAHSVIHQDAPNPGLKLDGPGPIGLPLNDVQVKLIMKDINTAHDTEQNFWRFPGARIQCSNLLWHAWLKANVIEGLHSKLDASIQGNASYERVKYLSIFAPHSESRVLSMRPHEESRQYTKLLIILPSQYMGGSIQCTYNGESRSFSTVRPSEVSTIVVGAYSNVTQILGPIESGYLVCLHFKLTCHKSFQIPRLPRLDEASKRLRLVFRSWREALVQEYGSDLEEWDGEEKDTQNFLLLVLKYKYSSSPVPFTAGSLQRCNRLLLSQVAPLAKAYDFDLHLGELACTIDGATTLKRRRAKQYDSDCNSFSEDSDNEIDPEDLMMDEDNRNGSIYISKVFALNGMPMKPCGIELYEDSDREQYCVNGDIFERKRTIKFEKEDKKWKTKVIIISPSQIDLGFEPADIREYGCRLLSVSTSNHPVKKEGQLANRLVDWVTTRAEKVYGNTAEMECAVCCVRRSAECWNDPSLFRRLLHACGLSRAISFVGIDGLMSASWTFTWADIEDLYTQMVLDNQTNEQRGQLVEKMRASAMPHDHALIEWCRTQPGVILNTLRQLPLSEVDWAFEFMESQEDPTETIQTKFLPKVHSVQPSDIKLWMSILSRLHDIGQGVAPSPFDKASLPSIIGDSLLKIATTMQPLPTDYTGSCWTSPLDAHYEAALDKVIPFIKLCARCDAFQVTSTLFQRMWDERSEHAQRYRDILIPHYYSLLLRQLDDFVSEHPQHRALLRTFFEHAVELLFPCYSPQNKDFTTALRHLDDPLEVFQQQLKYRILRTMPTAAIKSLGKWVSDTYRDKAATSPDFTLRFQAALDLCLSALGSHSFFMPTTWGVMGSKQALQFIQFCFSIRSHSEVVLILTGYLVHPHSHTFNFVKELLVPILSALPNILRYETYNSGFTIASRPFSDFACEAAIGCGCNPCNKHLVSFFNGPNQRIWGVGWMQGKKGRGTQLQIDKPPHLVALGQWIATQNEGKRLLGLLGNMEQQKQTLGADFEWVKGAIPGTTVPSAVGSGNPSLKRPVSDSNDESDQVKRARVQ